MKYDAQLRQLELQRESREREAFLETFEIADVKIRGIGVKRRALLLSFGIETAADITEGKLRYIPRLPVDAKHELVAWRHTKERKFRFDPTKAMDPKVLRDHKLKHVQLRLNGRQKLQNGAAHLRTIANELNANRPRLRAQLQAKTDALAQAKADALAIRWPFKQ